MHQGRVAGEFSRDEATQDGIVNCATGQVVAAAQASKLELEGSRRLVYRFTQPIQL